MTKLQEAQRDDKRSLILARAVNLFNESGFYDTRLEDVAARLGTAKTSISYHFKSKQTLLLEAYRATERFQAELLACAAQKSTGLQRVIAWLRGLALARADMLEGARPPIALIADLGALDPEAREEIGAAMVGHADTLRGFVRDGVADGSIEVRKIDAACFFLLNMPQWLWPWLESVRAGGRSASIDGLCDLICRGLAVDRTARLTVDASLTTADAGQLLFDRVARNRMKLDAFLRVGTRHLNRYGVSNLSLNAIAKELGASRGSLYYHIEDKEKLLELCIERTLDLFEDAVAGQDAAGADGLDRLHGLSSRLYQGHISDLDPLLRLTLIGALPSSKRRAASARLRRITASISEIFAAGVEDGSIRDIELEEIELVIRGAIFGATRQRYDLFGPPGRDAPGDSTGGFFEPLFLGLSGR